MNAILGFVTGGSVGPQLLDQPWVPRLGWTLVHFLWQGAGLAAIFAVVRLALRRRSPQARYAAACVTLLALLLAPVITFLAQPNGAVPLRIAASTWAGPVAANAAPVSPTENRPATTTSETAPRWTSASMDRLSDFAQGLLPWLVVLWFAGVGVMSARLVWGWLEVRRWRTRDTQPLAAVWRHRLDTLRVRLGVSRPVHLLQSALVEVPTILGWFRPIILLPASSLTGLSPNQIEFLLAHELAHLRRGDYWVNLVQIVAETVLFYHPAVWWVSTVIREEREHCCDDLAVAACGDAVGYARALATMEALRSSPTALALAANGGSLLARIRRLLGVESGTAPDWRRSLGTAFLGLGLVLILAGLVCLFLGPERYVATARVQVLPSQGSSPGANPQDPYFVETMAQQMDSSLVLRPVVMELKLTKRWGRQDQPLPTNEAVTRLQQHLKVRRVPDTSLIEISATDPNPNEAATIVNAVTQSFTGWREMLSTRGSTTGIRTLQSNWVEQGIDVSNLQTRVTLLRNKLGIPDSGSDEPGYRSSLEREYLNNLQTQLTSVESDYVFYKTKYQQLSNLAPDVLRGVTLTSLPNETILPQLLTDYYKAEQRMASITNDYGPSAPERKNAVSLVATINQQISNRLNDIQEGLREQVFSLGARLNEVSNQLVQARAHVAAEAPYWTLKRELANQQRNREAVFMRLLQERVDANAYAPPIVDPAAVSFLPHYPLRPLAAGLSGSGLLSLLLGLAVFSLRRRQ